MVDSGHGVPPTIPTTLISTEEGEAIKEYLKAQKDINNPDSLVNMRINFGLGYKVSGVINLKIILTSGDIDTLDQISMLK